MKQQSLASQAVFENYGRKSWRGLFLEDGPCRSADRANEGHQSRHAPGGRLQRDASSATVTGRVRAYAGPHCKRTIAYSRKSRYFRTISVISSSMLFLIPPVVAHRHRGHGFVERRQCPYLPSPRQSWRNLRDGLPHPFLPVRSPRIHVRSQKSPDAAVLDILPGSR
jgi:hypothetical protein